jgi:hypothetical protein
LGEDGGRSGNCRLWNGGGGHHGRVEKDVVRREIVDHRGKGTHDETVGNVIRWRGRTGAGEQGVHDAQLLSDRISAQDGGVLIDFKESKRGITGSRVQPCRIARRLRVGEGAEMVLHASGNSAEAVSASNITVDLGHGDIYQDVDLAVYQVGWTTAGTCSTTPIDQGDRRKPAQGRRSGAHHGANLG